MYGALFFLFTVLLDYSCQGKSEILKKAGSWQFEAPHNVVIEFYYVKDDLPENIIKNRATQIARDLIKSYPKVEIYIFYDKKLAKKVASNKFKEEVAKGAIVLNDKIFWDAEAKVMGGALLQMTKANPEVEWYFVERMPQE